jgi:glycosyltransferase involved in cell wall biosynthesis
MNLLLFNLKTDANDSVLGFTTDWVNAMAGRFDRVVVITMEAGRVAVADNVVVHSVGREKGYSEFRRVLVFYGLLRRVLREQRVDVCFAHMMPLFAVLGWPLLRARGIPIVLWYAHKSVTPTLRFAHRLVDRVVTSSPEGFQVPSQKVVYVGQGISLSKFPARSQAQENDSEHEFTVISVGRISPIKNIAGVLRGFANLAAGPVHRPRRLVILGGTLTEEDKAYEASMKRLADELGISESVTFAGPVVHEEVGEWVTRADLSVSLSETMSLDKTILESMAAGIPVLILNKAFLPVFGEAGVDASEFILEGADPAAVGRGMRYWEKHGREREGDMLSLRTCVRERHGLEGLAARISGELKSQAGRGSGK